ncbi:MAG TPA: hypothetical protein DCW41_00805 [Clostridiales bacterium]|nr:hypothetical protein [Clostridiales bacterium]
MELSYTFFYIEANIVCIAIFVILLLRSFKGIDRQQKQRVFDGILISHILYFLCDTVWVLILGDIVSHTIVTVSIINILNSILLDILACCWFIYTGLVTGGKYLNDMKNRWIVESPFVLSALTMTIMFIFFNDLMVGEDLVPTGLYYFLFISVPAAYIIISSVRLVMEALKKENFAHRSGFISYAIYPVVVLGFGSLQVIWLNAPLFCFGSTIMMVYVYIISLDNLVSLDPLTGLNNRAQLKRYVSNEIMWTGDDKKMGYVLMIDLNKFKNINDRYGHLEGDAAIVRAADAIRIACSGLNSRSFVCRYGGDEFIVLVATENEEEIKALKQLIKATLADMNHKAEAPYELACGIGYAPYSGETTAFQGAVKAADEALYIDKKQS